MTLRFSRSLAACLSLALATTVSAQLSVPLLHSVFPSGAQAGTTVEVTVVGSFLDGASELIFSDQSLGIQCEAIPNEEMPDYTTQFRLTIPKSAAPGTYDLFAKCTLGLSAPRPFVIGAGPEVIEPKFNGRRDRALVLKPGTIVNGRADENANDYYRIEAKAGEKYVVTCWAENLDSRMDATLVLYDSSGRELDRDRNNRDRNAVVAVDALKDEVYFLHVADFTYGGGHAYPYRLSMTTAPHLEFVFPSAGQLGSSGTYTLYGRNLPGSDPSKRVLVGNRLLETKEVEITLPPDGATTGIFGDVRSTLLPQVPYRLKVGSSSSNAVPIGVASAPLVLEGEESNDAQEISVPSEIHGRFHRARDKDLFRFRAKKDEQLWIEVVAERLGTSADPILMVERITASEDGTEQLQAVGTGDDLGNNPGERLFPLPCRDADLSLKIPADGLYQITLMNQTGSGGIGEIYRLVVREPRPSFDLVAVPWQQFTVANRVDVQSPIARPGGSADLRILALRREGFADEIELSVDELPEGVSSVPVKMGGAKSATMTLTAAPDAKPWHGMITVRGVGGEMTREARLGAVPWSTNDWSKQFFATRLGPRIPLSVPAEKAFVSVQGPEASVFEMTMGEKLELPVGLVKNVANAGEFLLRCEGLPHQTGQLKLPGGNGKGTLVVASGNQNEFPKEPGTWTFRIRAEGTIKYQPSKATLLFVRGLHKQLAAHRRENGELLEKLIGERDQALQQLDEAERATDPAQDPSGDEKLKALRTRFSALDEQLLLAQEKAAYYQFAVNRAAAEAKSTIDVVKERDVKIVCYSQPITITVVPGPEK